MINGMKCCAAALLYCKKTDETGIPALKKNMTDSQGVPVSVSQYLRTRSGPGNKRCASYLRIDDKVGGGAEMKSAPAIVCAKSIWLQYSPLAIEIVTILSVFRSAKK